MLNQITGLLPAKLRPYAKAIYPFVANLVFAGVAYLSTGTYDTNDLRVNVLGLIGVLLTFLVPNKPAAK